MNAVDKVKRILEIQEERKVLSKQVSSLQAKDTQLEKELNQLRSECEHVLPDGKPAWDDYYGPDNRLCRICYVSEKK